MNTVSYVIVLIGSGAVVLEGISSTLSKERSTAVGVLNCCLGVIGILFAQCIHTGSLVLAPEFGALMVQGNGPVWFVASSLIGLSVLPVLCLKQTRAIELNEHHRPIEALIGLAIGVWALVRLHIVNPEDFPELHFRMYDVWWPPLVLWLTYCFVSIALSLAANKSMLLRLGFTAAFASGLARFALVHQELSDAQSRPIWSVVQVIALILLCGALSVGFRISRIHKALDWALWLVPCAAAFVAGRFLSGGGFYGYLAKAAVAVLLVLLVYSLIWTGIFLRRALNRWRSGKAPAVEVPPAPVDGGLEPRQAPAAELGAKPRNRATQVVLWTSLLIIPILLSDLLSMGVLSRVNDFVGLLVAWLGFSAVLAADALDGLPQAIWNVACKHPVFGAPALTRLLGHGKLFGKKLSDWCKAMAMSLSSGSGWELAFRGILLGIGALILIVAVGEMFDYNKLVVEPLTWSGAGADSDRLAARIGDEITNELGNMQQEMLPVLLFSNSTGGIGTATGSPVVLRAVLDNGAVQAAMAKSADIQISEHVIIPISIFAEPIQRLVRWMLNIHSVGGSLYTLGDKKTPLIFLQSDRGESWRVPAEASPESIQETTVKSSVDTGAVSTRNKQATKDPKASEMGDAWSCQSKLQSNDPVDAIAQEAAFDIASNDPSFTGMGMTKNWKAYTAFRNGLVHWTSYQSNSNVGDLDQAIACFGRAFHEDNTFALAEYRAGIALESAGEVEDAIQAFDTCLQVDPSLIQAESAMAEALSLSDRETQNRPAIADIAPESDRTDQAKRLWAAVVSSRDTPENRGPRIAAYFGLCTHPFRLAPAGDRAGNKFYVNYYYCNRAQAIYQQLSEASRRDPERVKVEAEILNSIGETLNYHDYRFYSGPWPSVANAAATPGQSHWLCGTGLIRKFEANGDISFGIPGSELSSHALRYYHQALSLLPGNSVLLCEVAASEAYVETNPLKPMMTLNASSSAHRHLGAQFASAAQKMNHPPQPKRSFATAWAAAFYYRQAVNEYRRAAEIAPTDFEALNEFAYMVWQWSLDGKVLGDLPELPGDGELMRAEEFAREAMRVSRWRQDRYQEAAAEDTLGEILIAMGRNREALDYLRDAATQSANTAQIDEVRWDLAQALTCDAMSSGKTSAAEATEAASIFQKISDDEAEREFRPFMTTAGSLNPQAAAKRCFGAQQSIKTN